MSVAVVTGSTSGIGAALTQLLVGRGWTVVAISRSPERLAALKEKTLGSGQVDPWTVDLSEPDEVSREGLKIAKSYPKIDLVVNLAAVWHDDTRVFYGQPLSELPEQEILEVMNVGIIAPMLLTSKLIPNMPTHGKSSIVNLTGTFNSGGAKWIHYFTSKRALEQLTVALSQELVEIGIRVNAVTPADTATPALEKFFPEDAAEGLTPEYVVEFILAVHEDPRFEYVNGQIIELRRH